MSKFLVLWVYQTVKGPHGIKLEAGQKPSLCIKGRKHMLCVSAGHPVRVLKRAAADFDILRHVSTPEHTDYSVEKAIESLTEIGGRNGITRGAQLPLERAASGTNGIDESQFHDEEELLIVNTKVENPKPVDDGETL